MCQQTQVATVIPYYNRWMEKFPTIRALAAADSESVNAIWKGLGYYSRAARLLSGAQKVVKEFNGRLPEDPKEMEKEVPGIGRYSSGAIASIAYGVQAPVLDGNVHRLLSRLLALYASTKSKATLDVLWDAAKAFVDDKDCDFPGDVNQALIELGSTVCRVKNPICDSCPLRDGCCAYQETQSKASNLGVEDIEDLCTTCSPHVLSADLGVVRYPMKVERKKAREETDLVVALEWRNGENRRLVLQKRPDDGLLGGLWNFPNTPCIEASSSDQQLEDLIAGPITEVLHTAPHMTSSTISQAKRLSKNSRKPSPGSISSFFKKTESVGEIIAVTPSMDSSSQDSLKLVHVEHARPVTHVFSHIRKTYRPIWVILEGGSVPPNLKPVSSSSMTMTKKKKKPTKKRKVLEDSDDEISESEAIEEKVSEERSQKIELKWVKAEDVEHANVGTGVLKIWKEIIGLAEGKHASTKKSRKKS
ncbi:DNA glycosylase [Sistotremastrum suecicum HHB10207 ss-3]|uniref:Adenine DNA glycosylase n=1 Tax=Sistotremastrum suecicum HHB10207 ss-3 TaxID=1314776 RepID=A0A166GEF8_9AGAM|nr:DNA glycosylase [Sistotremastrum suecicum HHB10207 ss-3]